MTSKGPTKNAVDKAESSTRFETLFDDDANNYSAYELVNIGQPAILRRWRHPVNGGVNRKTTYERASGNVNRSCSIVRNPVNSFEIFDRAGRMVIYHLAHSTYRAV